jgi:holliday junction DNA helicase RuvA
MIGQITGKVIHKAPPIITLDVNGVGYEIFTPMNTFYNLTPDTSTLTLITHLIVREDHHALYGFKSHQDRDVFRHLIKVNGVGPKLALTVLSSMETHQFAEYVLDNNADALTRIPGIGKKTAERLIIDMRNKVEAFAHQDTDANTINSTQALEDAIRALHTLGYKPQEAKRAVQSVQQPNSSSEQLIRLALQHIAKG